MKRAKYVSQNKNIYKIIVNVSVHHYEKNINAQIYKTKLDMNSTKHHIRLLRKLGVPVRINCNFVKSGLDTKKGYKDDWLHKVAWANSIRFAELQNAEDIFIAAEDIFGGINKDPFNEGCE